MEAELFDNLLDKLRSKVRAGKGQKGRAALGIMGQPERAWIDAGAARLPTQKHRDGAGRRRVQRAERDEIETVKSRFAYLLQAVMRRQSGKEGFTPVHRRWIVERTFACGWTTTGGCAAIMNC